MDELELIEDDAWNAIVDAEGRRKIDSGVRLVASLLDTFDAAPLYRRTGMVMDADGKLADATCPLFVVLKPGERRASLSQMVQLTHGQVRIARVYRDDTFGNERLGVVPVDLHWPDGFDRTTGTAARGDPFRKAVALLAGHHAVARVSMPRPLQPCLEGSLRDIDLPRDRTVQGRVLDGHGIIVGIIDDGCALAHRHFLVPGRAETRILALWDQGRGDAAGGWGPPLGDTSSLALAGKELTKAAIDAALAQHVGPDGRIDEDAVYAALHYDLAATTHGTHVMDIACGNGDTLMGAEGVAPRADIVFVQLPTAQVAQGGPLLEKSILDGVAYVLAQAAKAHKPAVINISYGGYSGPHDGTSDLPHGIDQLLGGMTDVAVAVSAGNGFEADCHAQYLAEQASADPRKLTWILAPEDPTANGLEVWWDGASHVDLRLAPPGGRAFNATYGKDYLLKRRKDGAVVGRIRNGTVEPNAIHVDLNATAGETRDDLALLPAPGAVGALTAPAPSGGWKLQLRANARTPCHAWIARDDLVRGARRVQQSRFAEADADPCYTLADLATGSRTIAVGAHNAATGETCGYSASGPTRDGRTKPQVTAPAEETALGGGVRCASARMARPTPFNGTSASAPHVAGLVALLLQYRRDTGGAPLTVEEIIDAVESGAAAARMLPQPPWRQVPPNMHQAVDPHRPPGKRHANHLALVIGEGKVNIREAVKALP